MASGSMNSGEQPIAIDTEPRAIDWIDRDSSLVWHGFTQMATYRENYPVMVDMAEGRELIDVDGHKYIDAISSLWVNTLGHRVKELDDALVEQLGKVAHATMLGNGSTVVVQLAEALSRVVPVDGPHFLFASDGASAVEQALKIAFQYYVNRGERGRQRFLALGDAYHGDTVGAMSLGDSGFESAIFDPLRFATLRTPGYGDPGWLDQALLMLDAHANDICCAVVEPLVQGASGMMIARPEDVLSFREACAGAGVLFVADEVATGFGRTGAMFASEICGIQPDILCIGKGLTGGYLPMSATVVTEPVYAEFLGADLGPRTFYHGHSYGGNALCAAVALKHLELMENWKVLDNVAARTAQLSELLDQHVAGHRAVKEIRHQGLMAGIELDSPGRDHRWGRKVCGNAVKRGVLLRPLGDVVVLVLPLTITEEEVGKVISVLADSLDVLMDA
ncbi:MAG: adenosylmethionine--8-amino-7-oxononanoate transaminase [Actinobacteria bacterium]|nr:adenosylmethionine--8-amino-7-oxononanoate transaminase [Actinomycetota bacterium]